MSLIPYRPQEGREIVLRHRDAIVVRDSTSHRLEIRGLTECPTCHRPLPRATSPEHTYESSSETSHDSYVSPDYFRMLQTEAQQSIPRQDPPSPVRRLFRPAALTNSAASRGSTRERSTTPISASTSQPQDGPEYYHYIQEDDEDATEFISSTPGVSQTEGTKIRQQAFTPGYFKTFFKEERTLGKGGKGVVLLVRHEIDNCDLGLFACKRVPVGDDHAWLEKVLVEVGLLHRLSHPNLVSYRHVWLESWRLTRFGPSVPCAFILQQYCNSGDLHQYIIGSMPRETTKEELKAQARRRSKGKPDAPQNLYGGARQLTFEEIFPLFKDITSGVAYLHSNNYIHRDLKPSNCLLNQEGGDGRLRCLISDFGEVQPENAVRKSTGSTGTISYCAPEVLKRDASGRYANFTTKSDIFSLGMILYFMCFGTLPYRSANAIQEELEDYDELRAEISEWQGFRDERRLRPDLPSRLYKLLKRLLSLNAAERPSANEVLAAMRGENVFEAPNRVDQPASNPFPNHENRIQSLDSPRRGGTPVSDSSKYRARAEQDSIQTSKLEAPLHSFQDENVIENDEALRDRSETFAMSPRSHPMTITRSQRGCPEIPNDTPVPSEYEASVQRAQSSSPHMLMAPPRTPFQEVRFRLTTVVYYAFGLMGIEQDMMNHTMRMALFVAKICSLSQPCWPYAARFEVGVPLILMAALDLKIPNPGASALARRNRHGEIEFGPSRWRGLSWSLLLFSFHAFILYLARGLNSLCADPPRAVDWTEW